jgi:hypothetical protein
VLGDVQRAPLEESRESLAYVSVRKPLLWYPADDLIDFIDVCKVTQPLGEWRKIVTLDALRELREEAVDQGFSLPVDVQALTSELTVLANCVGVVDRVDSGAVYIFSRSGAAWSQSTYLKASNTDADDLFGFSVAQSADGSIRAVSAASEDSAATGIGGDQRNNAALDAGAVYVFR